MKTTFSGKSLTPRLLTRFQIAMLLQYNFHKNTISSVLGCHPGTVLNWKTRLQSDAEIMDRKRTGRPLIIPADATTRLISFYCQQEPLPGCERWTIRDMKKYFNKHPDTIKCSLSRSSIQRRLISHALRPCKNKYFLHISDPFFFEKMEKIIKVYNKKYEFLFCMDECTGLQVLERMAPYFRTRTGKMIFHENEYKRHGTVSIISFLRVINGKVYTECIPDHTSLTVISAVKKHALQYDLTKQLHYISDNYYSHSSEVFCRGIADLCNMRLPKLKTLPERKKWLESEDKRIVFHFLPTHGSWLNLVENWFGILQQKALKRKSFCSKTEYQDTILSFTDTWNTYLAHPFEWTYTGEDLYEKSIRRLIQWVQIESDQLSLKFIKKQIGLMSNLATEYWSKANIDAWRSLLDTMTEKDTFLRSIIGPDENLGILLSNLSSSISEKIEGRSNCHL